MADTPIVNTQRISRDQLATFLKSHELIKAFEKLISDVSDVIPGALANASVDADSIISTKSFLPPPPIPTQQMDDASRILSNQIFGA